MLDTTNTMLFELLIRLAKELVHNLQASKFGTEATNWVYACTKLGAGGGLGWHSFISMTCTLK